MSLANIVRKAMLTGTAIAVLGAGLVYGCNKKVYPVTPTEPTPIVTPAPTQEPTLTLKPYTPTPKPIEVPTPTITPTPTLETKLFEFIFPGSTPEQYKTFHDNALEDYRTVLKFYGINEKDARMRVSVWEGGKGYTSVFYHGGNVGTGGAQVLDDLWNPQYRQRGTKHEMAHAVNHTLFPTYHSWFDEGMSMYASGEVEAPIKDGRFDRDAQKLLTNPKEYWQYWEGGVPGHIIGVLYYGFLLRDYKMTPEQNRTALLILQKRYSETSRELTKTDLQGAYERVLGVSLNPLFELLKPGVELLYNTDPAKVGTKGAEVNKVIRSEFGITN